LHSHCPFGCEVFSGGHFCYFLGRYFSPGKGVVMKARENTLRAILRDAPEWVPNGLENVVMVSSPVVERPRGEGCDDFGVHWSLEEEAEGGTYPTLGRHPIADLENWREQLVVPDIDALDWTGVRAAVAEVDREEFLVRGFVEMGLFERSYLLLGMEGALIAYIEKPELMEELLGAVADYKIALIERFDDEVGLDMMWYGDDWGTQTSLFMPPETWRKTIRPQTQRIYDCMKGRDILIDQHSCGRIEEVFDDIVEMGAAMFNPCQPCNDLARLKREYGDRISFCGGIDSQFVLARPGVTPAEVRGEVRRRIDEMGTGGGYIAGPSHGVPYDQVLIDAMNDEIDRYGREVYRG
jgi:hypothetical protein